MLFILFQVGLKTLIGATVLLNASNEDTNNESSSSSELFIGSLSLDEPPTATNSAEFIITGEANAYDIVEFYINNTKIKEKKLTSKKSFKETIGKLKQGENRVYVITKTKDEKQKKKSEIFTVVYKKDELEIEINSPKDGQTISKEEILIEGKTEPETTVHINNQPVVVDFEGKFKISYRLKEGENKLEFVARDIAGNVETKSITVTYEKDE